MLSVPPVEAAKKPKPCKDRAVCYVCLPSRLFASDGLLDNLRWLQDDSEKKKPHEGLKQVARVPWHLHKGAAKDRRPPPPWGLGGGPRG